MSSSNAVLKTFPGSCRHFGPQNKTKKQVIEQNHKQSIGSYLNALTAVTQLPSLVGMRPRQTRSATPCKQKIKRNQSEQSIFLYINACFHDKLFLLDQRKISATANQLIASVFYINKGWFHNLLRTSHKRFQQSTVGFVLLYLICSVKR